MNCSFSFFSYPNFFHRIPRLEHDAVGAVFAEAGECVILAAAEGFGREVVAIHVREKVARQHKTFPHLPYSLHVSSPCAIGVRLQLVR